MLILLSIFSGAILLRSLTKREGFLEYPTLASTVYLVWVIPQLIGMRHSGLVFDATELFTLEMFCLVCLGALVAGWSLGISYGKRGISLAVSNRKLVQLATGLTLFTLAMTFSLRGVNTSDGSSDVNWSGPITIIYFFSNLKALSLFLVVYLFLSGERRKLCAILIALHVVMYLPALTIYFRRRAALEVFVILNLAYWYVRGQVLPRTLVLISIPFGMLFVFGVGALRGLGWNSLEDVNLAQIAAIDFWSYTPFQNTMQFPEMANAYYVVRYVSDGASFTLGADSWNRFIFQWIPGQLVGRDFKAALMFDIDFFYQALRNIGAVHRVGATNSAFGDAYMEGGFLGCVFFFVTAFVVGTWWERARRGDVRARIYYASGIASATLMLTAYPVFFFNFMFLFLLSVMVGLKIPLLVLRQRASQS